MFDNHIVFEILCLYHWLFCILNLAKNSTTKKMQIIITQQEKITLHFEKQKTKMVRKKKHPSFLIFKIKTMISTTSKSII